MVGVTKGRPKLARPQGESERDVYVRVNVQEHVISRKENEVGA